MRDYIARALAASFGIAVYLIAYEHAASRTARHQPRPIDQNLTVAP